MRILFEAKLSMTMRMLQHSCQRAQAENHEISNAEMVMLKNVILDIMQEYQRLWLILNRPGGLSDSMQGMEALLAEYSLEY
jgi:hypothetical protein